MDDWYDEGAGANKSNDIGSSSSVFHPHPNQPVTPLTRPSSSSSHVGHTIGTGAVAGAATAAGVGTYSSLPTSYGFSTPHPAAGGRGGAIGMQRSDYAGRSSFTPPPSTGDLGAAATIGGPMGPMGGYAAAGTAIVDEFADEPPLLEELGINFEHIWSKTQAVVVPTKQIDISYLDDTDLAGPLVFGLIFGAALLVRAKVHFGYIYGFGLFGCVAITLVLNLLGDKPIDVWRTCSVLGYSLLPVIALALLDIPLDLHGKVGLIFCPLAVCWSTYSSVRLFVQYLNMRHQRWLIAYPVGLLYACFVLITIF